MAITLEWNEVGSRFFEVGIDRVVIFSAAGIAHPWSGVTKVSEKTDGASQTPIYLDGQKVLETRLLGDFAASIEAITYPAVMGYHDGMNIGANGLGFGLQPKRPFDFSYRTLVGNDVEQESHGHKIHLVYNAVATAGDVTHSTITDTTDVETLTWEISTIPEQFTGRRPTAHVVLDTRKTDTALMAIMEGYIYGASGMTPTMPEPDFLISLFESWVPLNIDTEINFKGDLDTSETTIAATPGVLGDAWLVAGHFYLYTATGWVDKGSNAFL